MSSTFRGFDLNFYAKIFNFAALNKIRLLGLNIPYPVSSYIGQVGLGNIPKTLRSKLPQEIDLSNARHKAQFVKAIAYSDHLSLPSEKVDKMYQVQTLWEEYMAETAADFVNRNPEALLCVIAGVGHVKGRVGIPDRIRKRTSSEPFVIVPEQVEWIVSGSI